jgi:hypothetical protein
VRNSSAPQAGAAAPDDHLHRPAAQCPRSSGRGELLVEHAAGTRRSTSHGAGGARWSTVGRKARLAAPPRGRHDRVGIGSRARSRSHARSRRHAPSRVTSTRSLCRGPRRARPRRLLRLGSLGARSIGTGHVAPRRAPCSAA